VGSTVEWPGASGAEGGGRIRGRGRVVK
jgi:hypothetical protein